MPHQNTNHAPQDLSTPAIKAARRLQSLLPGRLYLFALIKMASVWFLFVITREGIKLERLEKGE